MTNNQETLERILNTNGTRINEDVPIFRCKIGDKRFQGILKLLNYRQQNILEIEKQNSMNLVEELVGNSSLTENEKNNGKYLVTRMMKIIELGYDIDYSNQIKKQLAEFQSTNSSFYGIPIQIADSHMHTYSPIIKILTNYQEPITIVRFDTHEDCYKEASKETNNANYLSQILFDDALKGRIKRVITTSGINEEETSTINGITHSLIYILNLPEIKEPSILDIDLDGHENWKGDCRLGGHCLARPSLSLIKYDNEGEILVHPKVVVKILKYRVKKPEQVLVALERAYRNRLFWSKVELDFFEELAI